MSKARGLADLGNAYSDGALSNRNMLINSDFQVSQRGDFTSAYAFSYANYTVDRWKLYDVGCDGHVTHKVKQQVNSRYTNTLYLECVTGGTGRLIARQLVEQPEGYSTHQLDGVTGTASAWVKSNSSKARLYIYGGFYVNVAHSGGGEWEYLTTTITGTTADSPIEVGVQIDGGSNNNTSISVGDYFEVAYIQLEYGDTATPFEHRSYSDQLQRCMRYYEREKIEIWAQMRGGGYTDAYNSFQYKTPKRTFPTVSLLGSVNRDNSTTPYGIAYVGKGGASCRATIGHTGYPYCAWELNYEADCEL
jgi:hypothetical protein